MGKNRIMVFSYFASKRGLDDTVGCSCNSVVEWCGYKTNYNKDKSNENITKLVKDFEKIKYITVNGAINRNFYTSVIINNEKFDIPSQFALIYFDEINNIKQYIQPENNKSKIGSPILLLLLSYLRMNMLRRQKGYIGKPSDKPEFCYRMYTDIETDIGVSKRYISKGISILEELDLIAIHNLPRWQDENKNWHTEVTLFVNKNKMNEKRNGYDKSYDYKQELLWGIEYINEKKFLNKKFDQNTEK